MPRSDLTSGIVTQLTAAGAFYGYLIEITLPLGVTLRYTTIDTGFIWNSYSWLAASIAVDGINWDGTASRRARIVFGDTDLTFWALALQLTLTDKGVRIYAVYDDAPDEAAAMWSGRIGAISRNGTKTELALANGLDERTAPFTRVQQLVNPRYLLPAGTILDIGGQRWILERQKSASG